MNRSGVYLALCVAGLAIPYAFLGLWLFATGLDPVAFVREMFSHPVAAFFSAQMLLTIAVVLVYISFDRRRRDVPGAGYALFGTFAAGPAFGLPLYLYLRERGRAR